MIREFAIEPEVMATWAHFRELWNDLGVSQGRLLSEYPRDWRDQVYKRAQQLSPIKAASIASRLKPGPGQNSTKKWLPSSRPYDKGKSWLLNAEQQLSPEGLAAIVAQKNPRDKSRVLVAGDFSKDQPPWHCHRQCKIPRTSQDIARCAAPLLAASEEVQLIDPHFDATLPRFTRPLLALLSVRKLGQPWKRCELHTQRHEDVHAFDCRKANCARILPQFVPAGSKLRVHFWSRKPGGEKLHPRFLLTELGGLQLDYGLDSGEEGEKTIVSLLDDSLWSQLRLDYSSTESSTFVLSPDSTIEILGQCEHSESALSRTSH